MLKIIAARVQQRYRTSAFPKEEPVLSDRFRGMLNIDQAKCGENCSACVDCCPTEALTKGDELTADLGRCLFCTECTKVCPNGAIGFSRDYRLAVRKRQDLLTSGSVLKLAQTLEKKMLDLFGRSLKLRQVSAGGCNGCEVDTNVLNTVVFDLGRFGVQFVASPRHADGLLVTGAVSQNMKLALQKTYEAIAEPKLVIAVGACAISGGPFRGHPEVCNGLEGMLPIDLYIPGCPPHPITILDGLLRLLNLRG